MKTSKTSSGALALALGTYLVASTLGAADTLSLAEYLSQVAAGNAGIRAQQSGQAALGLATREIETAFSPILDADLSYLDAKSAPSSVLAPDHILDTSASLGLSKSWKTGTFTGLSYKYDANRTYAGLSSISFGGTSYPLTPLDYYYTNGFSLTVSQPLWKNFGAKGTSATLRKTAASASSMQALAGFSIQQTLFQAEQAYVNLALARSVEILQRQSLERNREILQRAARRAKSNLGDRSDVLQAQSAVKQVELGLAQAGDELVGAQRAFNNLRGIPLDAPAERLAELAPPDAILKQAGTRADVVAAQRTLESHQAAVDEIADRYTPDVSVFATLGLNGGSLDRGSAFSQTTDTNFDTNHPSSLVGIKASVNLDFPLYQKVLEGARLAADAGAMEMKQKQADLNRDWNGLAQQWKGLRQRLALADELVQLQKEKADHEKQRLAQGRSSSFQVLRFEEDYAQARLLRLRLAAEARMLAAQAKLFNGSY